MKPFLYTSETKQATVCFIISFQFRKKIKFQIQGQVLHTSWRMQTCPAHAVVNVPVLHFLGSLQESEPIQLLEGFSPRDRDLLFCLQDRFKVLLKKYNNQSILFGKLEEWWVGNRIRESAQTKVLGWCHNKNLGWKTPEQSPESS